MKKHLDYIFGKFLRYILELFLIKVYYQRNMFVEVFLKSHGFEYVRLEHGMYLKLLAV